MLAESANDLPSALTQSIGKWQSLGWVRALDTALVSFLRDTCNGNPDSVDDTTLLMALLTSQQLGAGHICLDLQQLLDSPATLFPPTRFGADDDGAGFADAIGAQLGNITLARLLARLQKSSAIAEGESADTDTDNQAPLVLDGHRLYLRRYWRYETVVSAQVLARAQKSLTPPDDLHARLDQLFSNSGNNTDTDWQRVACALATRQALTVITGGPGTGKTTTVVRLLGLLQSVAMGGDDGQPLRIRLAAPTGKAAARLSESIGNAVSALPLDTHIRERIPTSPVTLHRLLGSRPGTRHFSHNRHNPLHADLVVVDEASMIDLEMMAALLDALRPETRLVLIGDKDQLASVDAGAVMADLCREASAGLYSTDTVNWLKSVAGEDASAFAGSGTSLAQATAMLRKNWRFAGKKGIGALALAINQGDPQAAEAVWEKGHGELQRLALGGTQDKTLDRFCTDAYAPLVKLARSSIPATDDAIDAHARAVLAQLGDFQLLCVLREGPAGVSGLNQRIAHGLYRQQLIEREDGWYAGRPVIVTRNDYALGLMNGDVGVTLAIQDGGSERLRVAFALPDGSIKLVLPSRLGNVQTVFAMTVHKSQGSEFRHTALMLPDSDHPAVTRELLYTAVTRAREQFSLLCPKPGVEQSGITRRTWRASGLADRLG